MSIFTLYLIAILDSLNNFFEIGTCLSFMGIIGSIFVQERFTKIAAGWLCSTVILALLAVVTPTTDAAWKIVAIHYGTNIPNVEKLPENAVSAIHKYLQDYLDHSKE